MPQGDSNDIIFDAYQVDLLYIGRAIFDLFGFDGVSYSEFVAFLSHAWTVFTILSLIVSCLIVIGIVYAYIRYNQMGELETIQVETQHRLYRELYGEEKKNSRWEDIQSHISSDNPNDWKLSIIEADVMLEEALDDAGYTGATIGDKLKGVPSRQLGTLDDAWSAHKVRNQIAHGGTEFILTHKMAQDTIGQYRRVFHELGVI